MLNTIVCVGFQNVSCSKGNSGSMKKINEMILLIISVFFFAGCSCSLLVDDFWVLLFSLIFLISTLPFKAIPSFSALGRLFFSHNFATRNHSHSILRIGCIFLPFS